jgi:hypothetical protein
MTIRILFNTMQSYVFFLSWLSRWWLAWQQLIQPGIEVASYFFFPVDFTTDPSSNLEPSSLIVVRVMVDQIISKTNFPQVLSVDVHPTEPWLVHTSCFI